MVITQRTDSYWVMNQILDHYEGVIRITNDIIINDKDDAAHDR